MRYSEVSEMRKTRWEKIIELQSEIKYYFQKKEKYEKKLNILKKQLEELQSTIFIREENFLL